MIRKTGAYLIVWISAVFFLQPPQARAQLILGQYEEEAPFGTWNTFAPARASSIGRGGTCFTLAADSSASLSNPALLLLLPRLTVMVNGSADYASFFKYSLVNTGVLGSNGNLSQTLYALDYSGISLHLGKWAYALTVSINELYNRPSAYAAYSAQETVLYSLSLTQTGILRSFNLSAAHSFNDWLSAGLGINFSVGDLERKMVEQWTQTGISITDRKTRDLKEFNLNGGLLVNLEDRVRLAAVFRAPCSRQSKNHSFLEYVAPAGPTDIQIEASSVDKVRQPLVLGLGASYKLLPNLWAALDLSYYNWSRYSVDYFGEDLERDFRDVLKVGAGLELQSFFRIFGQRIDFPVRLGLVYDPQPMRNPRSSYASFTVGGGIAWQNFKLDFGALVGREYGSGNNLAAGKFSMSLTFQL